MKLVSPLAHAIALTLVAMGAPSWAAQHDQHKAHHPAASASAAAAKAMPGKTTPEMARMANQKKAMQEMHDKMMAAKTAEERNALMAEHMKTMQEGMGMMKGMGGMGGMAGPKSAPADLSQRQTMMEQRMDMMQTMMEMMVDRLPQSPAKP